MLTAGAEMQATTLCLGLLTLIAAFLVWDGPGRRSLGRWRRRRERARDARYVQRGADFEECLAEAGRTKVTEANAIFLRTFIRREEVEKSVHAWVRAALRSPEVVAELRGVLDVAAAPGVANDERHVRREELDALVRQILASYDADRHGNGVHVPVTIPNPKDHPSLAEIEAGARR